MLGKDRKKVNEIVRCRSNLFMVVIENATWLSQLFVTDLSVTTVH